MKIVNNIGPRILPCGIPLTTGSGGDNFPPTLTLCCLPDRKDLIHLNKLPWIPYALNLMSSLSWGTESKAFLKSK